MTLLELSIWGCVLFLNILILIFMIVNERKSKKHLNNVVSLLKEENKELHEQLLFKTESKLRKLPESIHAVYKDDQREKEKVVEGKFAELQNTLSQLVEKLDKNEQPIVHKEQRTKVTEYLNQMEYIISNMKEKRIVNPALVKQLEKLDSQIDKLVLRQTPYLDKKYELLSKEMDEVTQTQVKKEAKI